MAFFVFLQKKKNWVRDPLSRLIISRATHPPAPFGGFDPRPSVATGNWFRDPCRQRVDVGGGRGTKVGGSRVEPPLILV